MKLRILYQLTVIFHTLNSLPIPEISSKSLNVSFPESTELQIDIIQGETKDNIPLEPPSTSSTQNSLEEDLECLIHQTKSVNWNLSSRVLRATLLSLYITISSEVVLNSIFFGSTDEYSHCKPSLLIYQSLQSLKIHVNLSPSRCSSNSKCSIAITELHSLMGELYPVLTCSVGGALAFGLSNHDMYEGAVNGALLGIVRLLSSGVISSKLDLKNFLLESFLFGFRVNGGFYKKQWGDCMVEQFKL